MYNRLCNNNGNFVLAKNKRENVEKSTHIFQSATKKLIFFHEGEEKMEMNTLIIIGICCVTKQTLESACWNDSPW
jgi:hypothetical protein